MSREARTSTRLSQNAIFTVRDARSYVSFVGVNTFKRMHKYLDEKDDYRNSRMDGNVLSHCLVMLHGVSIHCPVPQAMVLSPRLILPTHALAVGTSPYCK